ncbi:MAG: hypothetical protein AAFS10_16600 [Myxococcota bacterium]
MSTYQPQDYELALKGWITAALGDMGETGWTVGFADQPSAPRPVRPFITVKVLSLSTVGLPVTKLTNVPWPSAPTDYTQEVTHQREGTASIGIFADDHARIAAGLVDGLHGPAIQEALDTLGITIRQPIALVDAISAAGPVFEGRTNLDVPFAFLTTSTHRAQATEQANVTAITLDL